jgi:hypothetical protein
MAAPRPPDRHRARWALLGVAGLLIVLTLAGLSATALIRSEQASAPASPAPVTQTPTPLPSTPAAAAESVRQQRQYRVYVSDVVVGGTAVVASMVGLAGCRMGQVECVHRIDEASGSVGSLQQRVTANPAPSCLGDADRKLQDALAFQHEGLDLAREGVETRNRVWLLQGALLTAAGLWRAGQAVVDGRRAEC